MNLKELKFREWAVIIFIILGLLALIFEKQFSPKIYEAIGEAEGFSGKISVSIKAYKKGEDVRIKEINVSHSDTEAIANPAIDELKNLVLTKQNTDFDNVAGATFTSNGFKEALNSAIENIK